jgi:PAS domain S-box-containing protein
MANDDRRNSDIYLRQHAEEVLKRKSDSPLDNFNSLQVLHELRVHQIELEMQNDELQKAQFELENSKKRYFDLYNMAPVGYCTLNDQGLITEANLTSSLLLGTNQNDLIGQSLSHFVFKDDQDLYYFYKKEIIKNQMPKDLEIRMVKNDGTSFWGRMEGTKTLGEEGAQTIRIALSDVSKREKQLLLANMDLEAEILARKKTESDLEQSEALATAILNSSPDQIAVVDSKGFIIAVNNSWKYFALNNGLLAKSPVKGAEVGSNYLATCLESNEMNAYEGIKAVIEGQLFNFTMDYPCQSPTTERWFRMTVSSLKYQWRGAVIAHADITDITIHKNQLQKTNNELKEANESLQSFSYSVSHDLKGPLNVMVGFTKMILEDHSSEFTPKTHELFSHIVKATHKMGEVINGLLELSRLSRTELIKEDVNLSFMAQNIANDLQLLDPQRKVHFLIAPQIKATADSHLLLIVMSNLLANAYKFTAKVEEAQIEFGQTKIDGLDTYFVKDNGAGFDMKHIDKLFKPFERLHSFNEFPGTGIGLTTVLRVIQRHGGKIWAKGEKNHGATFYFTL